MISHSLSLIKVRFSYDTDWCDYPRSNLYRSLTRFPLLEATTSITTTTPGCNNIVKSTVHEQKIYRHPLEMLLTVKYANHLRTRMRLFSGLTVREFEPEVKAPFWFHCASSLPGEKKSTGELLRNGKEMRSGSGREVNSRWTSNLSRKALPFYSTSMSLARFPARKCF